MKDEEIAIECFAKHGGFCRTGGNRKFTLEAFLSDADELSKLLFFGGNIYAPRPSHPSQYTWRLYGNNAIQVWLMLRKHRMIGKEKRMRGDRKLGLR